MKDTTIVKAAKRQAINHVGARKYLTGVTVAGSGAKSKNPEVIERLDHLDGVGMLLGATLMQSLLNILTIVPIIWIVVTIIEILAKRFADEDQKS